MRKFKIYTVVMLVLVLVINSFSTVLAKVEDNDITVDDTSFKGFVFKNITPENKNVTYERVLMRTKEQKELRNKWSRKSVACCIRIVSRWRINALWNRCCRNV